MTIPIVFLELMMMMLMMMMCIAAAAAAAVAVATAAAAAAADDVVRRWNFVRILPSACFLLAYTAM